MLEVSESLKLYCSIAGSIVLEADMGLWCVAGALVGEIYGPSDGRINGCE